MPTPLRVLHIEDNPEDARILEEALNDGGFAVTSRRVETRAQLIEALRAEWDVVLADHDMPGMPGLAALQEVRNAAPETPFLFVAGDMGEDAAVAAMRAGAQDCLGRQALKRLVPAVERELGDALIRREKHAGEQRFRELAETISEVFWTAGPTPGRLLYINPGCERLWGYTATQILSDATLIPGLIIPEDRDIVDAAWQQMAAGHETNIEFRMVHPDGSHRWIWDRGYPVKDEQGAVVRINGLAVDITDRKRAEAAVWESQARLAGLIASAMDAIITVDSQLRIVLFNASAERMFGRPVEQARGRSLTEFIPDGLGPWSAGGGLVSSGQTGVISRVMGPLGSLVGVRAGGETFPIEASVSQTMVGGERLLTVILRDITERQQAEQARAKMEAQLRQSQKLEAIGALAGGIAHDFNNALGAVLGHAELLKLDLPDGHPSSESVNEILKAARRSSDVVRQMLLFGRKQEQARAPVDLSPIIKEGFKLLRASFPAGIEMRLDVMPPIPLVLADPGQIHQLVMNLATNAAAAMDAGRGRFELRFEALDVDAALAATHRDLHEGRYVRLSVTDTGRGMDAATLERIFEPFFTTKAPGHGAGLGLAVVHGIARNHQGAIAVYSQPDKGTTFHVYLPAVPATQSDHDTEFFNLPRGTGQRILFVDDELALAKVADRVLRTLGYNVTFHTRPGDAIEAFRAAPQDFHLVIADLTMPGMSGLDVVRKLREIRADVPVILSTGYHGTLNPAELETLGIRELLTKPISTQRLGKAAAAALRIGKG
jgi:PAS domain S-box-containing protein